MLNYCALTQYFKHIGGWSACKLAFLIALAWSPGLQATHPPHPRFWAHGCVWIIFFPTEMQIFESSNKNTISTTTLYYGDHWDFDVSIFLKSIDLKVLNLIAPLRRLACFNKHKTFVCSAQVQSSNVDRRLQLYALAESGTCEQRSISSLNSEAMFGNFQDLDQNGSCVLRRQTTMLVIWSECF